METHHRKGNHNPTRPEILRMIVVFLMVSVLLVSAGCRSTDSNNDGSNRANETGTKQRETDRSDTDATELYPVTNLELEYLRQHPDQPHLRDLRGTGVRLVRKGDTITAPGKSGKGKEFTLRSLFSGRDTRNISAGALQVISRSLVQALKDRGLMGVYVNPHPEDIDRRGTDLRSDDNKDLRFLIHVAQIESVNTEARGNRIPDDKKKNHPAHRWIREHSPLQPGDEDNYPDLLFRPKLDRYINFLNRHPGRNASIAVSGGKKGKAKLNYRVAEQKPWRTVGQISNTGTENTRNIVERYSFVHNQLSGNDDVLSLDISTTRFDEYTAGTASYETPLTEDRRTRGRITGSYSEFTSSDVGLADADFTGQTTRGSLGIRANLHQSGKWFLDLNGGLEFKNIQVDNELTGITGDEDFLKPSLGLQLERKKRIVQTSGSFQLDGNVGELAGTDEDDISNLGRTDVERDWILPSAQISQSFYLEPLIYGEEEWKNPKSPDTSTLAHEIRLSGQGQHSLDQRLIPQEKFVIGGLHTVRGYPQSAVSGDSGYVVSAEYRFHLPRIFPIDQDPDRIPVFNTPFRVAPEHVFGMPDWDAVLTVFTETGEVTNYDTSLGVETHEQLWSVGAGTELSLKQNFRVQAYWGYAMEPLDGVDHQRGESEFHFAITLSY